MDGLRKKLALCLEEKEKLERYNSTGKCIFVHSASGYHLKTKSVVENDV